LEVDVAAALAELPLPKVDRANTQNPMNRALRVRRLVDIFFSLLPKILNLEFIFIFGASVSGEWNEASGPFNPLFKNLGNHRSFLTRQSTLHP
jgi:hypothetical protein